MRNRQVHLDFHTSGKIQGIGSKFSKEQFQAALKVGHVDSITLFSKCHHGWAYHPTEANEIHPHLNFDLLGAQIEAAKEIGVNTPIYLSAGFDEKYAEQHPEYMAQGDPDKKPDLQNEVHYHRLCMNTPYLDVLLNQITEVLHRYDGDGIFLDIVGVHRCYCDACMKTMQQRGWDYKDEEKVIQLAEEVYATYTSRVRETVDKVKPGHPVFHNAGHITAGKRYIAEMNTHLELESLPTGGWGYDHFPLTVAYARNLGMDYLGMTGKFHTAWGEFGGFKHPNALRFEGALSVANGAAVSIGDQLHPTGEMDMVTYNSIGKTYAEIEALEPWLQKGEFVSDIALLSQEAVIEYYDHPDFDIYGRNFAGNQGAGRMLLEGQYTFDVIDVEQDLAKYRVVVLPDSIVLDDMLTAKLKAFTAQGGKVLATGCSGLNKQKTEYALDFGAKFMGASEYKPSYIRPLFDVEDLGQTDYIMYSDAQKIELTDGKELAQNIKPYFNRTREHFCSHSHTPSSGAYYGTGMAEGKDGIVIPWNIFEDYATKGSLICKRIVHFALEQLLGEHKSIQTNLQSKGIATLVDLGDKMRCHLLYASPIKRGQGVEIVEEILPVYNVQATVAVEDKSITKVYAVPQQEALPFTQSGDKVSFTLSKLENHQVVILE